MLDKHMSAGQKRSPQTPIRKRVLVSTQRYELAQAESNDDDNGSGTQQYLTASTCPTLSTKNGAITVNSSLEMPEDPLDNGACGKERISYDSLTNLYEGNLISSTKIAEEIIRDEITFRPASLIDAEAYRTIDSFIEDAYCAASNVGRLKFWMIFIVLGFANLGDSAELASVGYLLASDSFQDGILQGNMTFNGSLVASISLVGMIIGGLVAGAFEDSMRRKSILMLGLILNCLSYLVSAFAVGIAAFAIFRFCAGLGMGAILSSLIALAAELAPPSKRGLFVTVVSGFWSFGMMYVAFIAYITMGLWGLSWRPFVALSGLPAALSVLLVWCFVPESARFLALHGKYDEATRSANDIAARIGYRGKKIEMVELYYQYYHQNHCMDSSAQGATLRESIREASKNIAALYSAELRNSTISLQLLWIFLEMGSGLASFVNVIFKEERANEYLGTFVGAIGDLIGKVVGAILLDKASRKWIALWSLVSASVTLLCFAWTVHRKKQEFARLALSVVVFAMLLSIGWSANLVMTSEMFPTKVRSTALGFVASSGRLANVVQQFINGALIDRPAILLSVASGILMLGALTTRIIKTEDMTGQDLTDTISHDGERRDFVLVPFSSCHKDGDVKQEGEVSLPPPVV